VSGEFPYATVLVTGAGGWLGSRLVESLARGLPDDERFSSPAPGLRIKAFLLPGEDAARLRKQAPQVEIVTGDVSNPADCARLCAEAAQGLLVHTAGVIHPHRARDFTNVNLEGTKNVLDAAIKANVRRAVVVSSNSPIGCNPTREHRFDENSPYNPYMGYGRSKMEMELAVKSVQESGRLETVIIRPPWFYGPNQPPRQGLFFRMIRDGKAPVVGDGNNVRSMAYIDNLCQGLLLASTVDRANGQIYWIADRRAYTMNEIIDTIERLLEDEFHVPCAHKRLRLPSLASTIAMVVDQAMQTTGLYNQKIHVLGEMNKNIACSVRKAEEELGYKPTIELKEGMRRSLAWMKEVGRDELFRP